MKTTRREFLGTSAGIVGSLALGSAGTTWANDNAEDAPTRLLTYHGLRPTDPGGRVGLRNPEKVKTGAPFQVEIELVNRGFSTLHNPRPVCLALMDRTGKVAELPVPDVDPRQWQQFRPGDGEFKPIVHRLTWRGPLPAGCPPGWQQIGLWLPDAAESLRRDPRYAVRVANRDVPWWTDVRGQYGINVLGVVEAVS